MANQRSDSTEVIASSLHGLSFGAYSGEEILRLSVKEINNPQTFDTLNHANANGLYDTALGPADRDDYCGTCSLNNMFCPGHMGHVVLPMPVFNPVLFSIMFQLLRNSCFHCHRLRNRSGCLHLFSQQIRLLDLGFLTAVYEIETIYNSVVKDDESREPEAMSQIDDVIANLLKEDKNEKARPVRNVTECRQQLLKEFLTGKYPKVCPHCGEKQHTINQQQQARIYVKKTRSASKKDAFNYRQAETETDQENEHLTEVDAMLGELGESSGENYLTPNCAKIHMRQMWTADQNVLHLVLGAASLNTITPHPTDVFFLDVMPVPPSRFRPISVMNDQRFENSQTTNLLRVIEDTHSIRNILAQIQRLSKGDTTPDPKGKDQRSLTEQLYSQWLQLQMHVNSVIDSDLAVTPSGSDTINGIRQLLEKKTGLFRKHMMGKRVNFAARSVISPDPYINTNEVGIPDVFAKKLTYPEPVTHWNFHQLKQAVINGPDVHPGANIVVMGNGRKILLKAGNRPQREAIANQLLAPDGALNTNKPNKTVYRHLKNGDVMLLNRQPTLHRPSIQAHKARILPGEKTIRLHYANCKAYNADFDGDEMNAHFPQNEICRAESYHIASTANQYLVPKDGTPLAGLIQDHMVSGVMLTIRGRFFCRSDYQQLVYAAMTDHARRLTWLPPSILKPQRLWSGKQVLSTLILNTIPPDKPALNLIGKAKIPYKEWITGRRRPWMYGGTPLEEIEMSESEVVISSGELLVGVLDKGHYGATPYGLIHSCYELYGGDVSSKLLTYLGKLFTTFLQKIGFTLGVQDIMVTRKANKRRRKFIQESSRCGDQVAAGIFNVVDTNDTATLRERMQRAHFDANTGETKDLDLAMKGKTDEFQNSIARVCIPHGLHMKFPQNNLQLMVLSGAKGSSVNCMQISCLLGQIELEGKRPPRMLSGQTLPSFRAYDTSPRAGGFVAGRFLTGIRPQEYFFHCMAGREGLVDTAVKTSRSGYLQRCIVKHLEGLVVAYDLTVRDSDGSVIQFLYGDEGLDITKTQFLNTKQFPFLIRNHENLATNERVSHLENLLDSTSSDKQWKKLKKWRKQQKRMAGKERKSGFLNFCRKNALAVDGADSYGRSAVAVELCNMWKELDSKDKDRYCKKARPSVAPVISQLRPDRHFGAISEAFHDVIENYLSQNPDQLLYRKQEQQTTPNQISAGWFKRLLYLRTLESLTPPGEAVGLLAAQSIGEPSTQMTLNTFHFAGRGEMNVTLGIPRLREILMTAGGNIKTPTMDIPLLPTDGARRQSNLLKKKLTRTCLDQLLQNVDVVESLSIKGKSDKYRVYDIRFQFLPYENYENEYFLTAQKILQYMEQNFFLHLQNSIKKRMNELLISSLLSSSTLKKKAFTEEKGDGANRMEVPDEDLYDDDFGDDGDASAMRSRDRQLQERDYEGEEEEMDEMGIDDRNSDIVEGDIEEDSDMDQEQMDSDTASQTTSSHFSLKHQKRISNVLLTVSDATKYQYDVHNNQWCRITLRFPLTDQKIDVSLLIENEAKKTVVYQTPEINRCFLSESRLPGEEGLIRLKTDGVNIQEMYKYHDILDLNKLYTNDVQAIADTYGIEAAGRAIIKEMRDVFAAYGIDVNYRHLSIMADYMTFQGRQLAFSRTGIAANPSPFQKMTYETSMQFLKAATVQGARDDLKSPSSRLVVGQLVNGGTGSFTLVEPFS